MPTSSIVHLNSRLLTIYTWPPSEPSHVLAIPATEADHKGHPSKKKENDRASQQLWRAKHKDYINEKNRKYYEAKKAALLQSGQLESTRNSDARKQISRRRYEKFSAAVSQYQKEILRRTGTLEAISKPEATRRFMAERNIERERRRAEIIAEGERRRAANKAETERRRAQRRAEREQRRAEQQAQRQISVQQKAMLDKERATQRAARADAKLKAIHDSLQRKAARASRRAEDKTALEQRREQRAERRRQIEHQKAMLTQERATKRAARAEAKSEAKRDSLRWKAERAERAESARRRAADKIAREQRYAEQIAERQRHLGHQKAILAREGATSRAAMAELNREVARQKAAEYRQDSNFRKGSVAKEQQRRTDHNYAHRQDMRTWLLRCPQRDQFSWKTHFPVVYDHKAVKTCSACGKTRAAGSRLWWQSLVNPDKYECHLCHAADCVRAMPRGFEAFEFGKGKHLKP